ncbi:MAG: hypothetical protein KC449_19505 [Anaerolineales bacterium]|nr:hypothetical protein [Anaerolineales bacterium]
MNTSQATVTMVLLFALRCLVPMALMFGIGYAMNWLVDRWEAEAASGTETGTAVSAQKASACWSIIGCDPEERQNCPGFTQQAIPCWLARTQAEGALPDKCLSCPIYEENPSFA